MHFFLVFKIIESLQCILIFSSWNGKYLVDLRRKLIFLNFKFKPPGLSLGASTEHNKLFMQKKERLLPY